MGSVTYEFSDETVIVTGASSGIGRQIALRFGAAGATVLNGDLRRDPRDRDAERPTHAVIEDNGGTGVFVETDVTDPTQLVDLVDRARKYGGVDVMVNNAGIFVQGRIEDVTPEDLDRVYETNVRGTYFGCQAAAEDMRDRGDDGVIVNLASISSVDAQAGLTAYDMSKAAIRMITKTTALEFAEDGVRVTAIAPGITATEFGTRGKAETRRAVAEAEGDKPVPMRRAGEPGEMAGPTLFLASEDASYVTGETFFVDGGYTAY